MLTRAVPILNPTGSVREWVGMNRDITEHKLAADALRLSHAELELQVLQRTASLRRLAIHVQNAQDDERRRIARELHDSVGQYLVSVKMNLAQVDQAEAARAEAEAAAADNARLYQSAQLEIERRTTAEQALRESWQRFQALPQAVEMMLFRSLQETLTNVHRHSGSAKVDVRIEIEGGQIGLTVRDYGRGIARETLEHFHTAGPNLGVGLTGMRERVTELGGNLQVLSENPGTLVRVTVPVGQE